MIKIKEGSAVILLKREWLQNISSKTPVFYNPVMRVNRDLSVLILMASREFLGRKLKVLDAMASSGIRSIRFLKETDAVKELIACDINETAIEYIRKNFEVNGVNGEILKEDCRIVMLREKFDYIDIDPFGPPIGFVEPAILSLKNKGVLGVTATDVSALSGSKEKACLRKYFCKGIKTDFYLEFGIRNLARYVTEIGAKHDIAMIPIFAYYYQHHYRVFFKKIKSKKISNEVLNHTKHIVYCRKCLFRDEIGKSTCNHKESLKVLGPIFLGSLYDDFFTTFIFSRLDLPTICDKTKKIVEKIYNGDYKLKEVWHYFDLHFLAKSQGVSRIPKMKEVLEKYNAVRTHFSPTGVKCKKNFILLEG